MLWRHRSRDQNRPKFNIRSKSLLELFSKNIFKRSCSLIHSVLKSGYVYFFLKKRGSRKSKWKFCQLPGQRPFGEGIKENFAKGLRVCSLFMALAVSSNFNCFWRGWMFKIFFRGEGLVERTKTRLYFRALFVHCDAASQKEHWNSSCFQMDYPNELHDSDTLV